MSALEILTRQKVLVNLRMLRAELRHVDDERQANIELVRGYEKLLAAATWREKNR